MTPYPDVDAILAVVLAGVEGALGEQLVGLYVGGSLATGAFDPETSDVDFVVVTEREVTEEVGERLRSAHARITAGPSAWAKKLEGMYVPRETLRTRRRSTQRCAYLGTGAWFGLGTYQSDWILQLHLVREHGIVVKGPDPKLLIDPISAEEIRASCAAIMRDWAPLLADTSRFDAEYQAYTVLTMCRMRYTLEHGAIVSKAEAADWAKGRLGDAWAPLIERALAWRHGESFDALPRVLELLRSTNKLSGAVESAELATRS